MSRLWKWKESAITMRPYQQRLVDSTEDSATLVVPCGGGKTIIGIAVGCKFVAKFKKSKEKQTNIKMIIVCISQESCAHWKTEFNLLVNVHVINITRTDELCNLDRWRKKACVVIVTYNMLLQYMTNASKRLETVVVIVDEAHHVPAEKYKTAFKEPNGLVFVKSIGLTATPTRTDGEIGVLYDLIGAQSAPIPWKTLESEGFIATIRCVKILCPIDIPFYKAFHAKYSGYHSRSNKSTMIRSTSSLLSPPKLRQLRFILNKHPSEKIIVFIEGIKALIYCSKLFHGFVYYGDMEENERRMVIELYKSPSIRSVPLFMSKVGDTGINLPDAQVVIEMGAFDDSERQLTQRVGRVARKKGGIDNNHATYYAILNDDGEEDQKFRNRFSFLQKEGYEVECVAYEGGDGSESGEFTNEAICHDAQQIIENMITTKEEEAEAEAEELGHHED